MVLALHSPTAPLLNLESLERHPENSECLQ